MAGVGSCAICTEGFDTPKVLPCGHSFCLRCLNDWAAKCWDRRRDEAGRTPSLLQPGAGRLFPCPECRQKWVMPQGGVAGFPTNVALARAGDEGEGANKNGSPVCGSCTEGNQAVVTCFQCRDLLCQDCLESHKRLKVTRGHTVEPLDKNHVNGDSFVDTLPGDYKPCVKHRGKPLEYFCKSCSVVCCLAGTATEHKLHQCITLDEQLDDAREVLASRLEDIENAEAILDSVVDTWENSLQMMKDHYKETKYSIDKRYQYLVNVLARQVVELVKSIDEEEARFDAAYRNINQVVEERNNSLKKVKVRVQDSIKRSKVPPHELGENLNDLESSVLQVCSEALAVSDPMWPELALVARDDDPDDKLVRLLGDLVAHNKPTVMPCFSVKCKSDSKSCDIADIEITSEGNIAVVDSSNGTVKVFSQQGDTIKQSNGVWLRQPTCIQNVPGEVEHLFVIDMKADQDNVYKWNIRQDAVSQFMTSGVSYGLGAPINALTVSGDNNLLLMAETFDGISDIHLCDLKGSLMTKFATDWTIGCMAGTAGQSLCIINDKFKSLCAFDYRRGRQLWKVGRETLLNPRGVCMTSSGETIVADTGKCQVLLLSKTGSIAGILLGPADGLKEPSSVAYSEEHRLLVVGEGSTGLVRLYHFNHTPS